MFVGWFLPLKGGVSLGGGVGAMTTGGGGGQVELVQTEVMSESFTTQLFLSLEIILTPRSTQVC